MDEENTNTNRRVKFGLFPTISLVSFVSWIILLMMAGIFEGKFKVSGILVSISGVCLAGSIWSVTKCDYNPWKSIAISTKIKRRSVLFVFFLLSNFGIVTIYIDRLCWILSVIPAAVLLVYNAAKY